MLYFRTEFKDKKFQIHKQEKSLLRLEAESIIPKPWQMLTAQMT